MARASKRVPHWTNQLRWFGAATVIVTALTAWSWYAWGSYLSDWKEEVVHYVHNADLLTFRARYSPEEILSSPEGIAWLAGEHGEIKSTVKYYPYLLIDLKYTEGKQSREGRLLWGFNDGEMVLDTETWETTHGFRDCLDAAATRDDCKILQTLAAAGGILSLDDLQRKLQVRSEPFQKALDQVVKKHLVVIRRGDAALHFEKPRLAQVPNTRLHTAFLTRPSSNEIRVARNYSKEQIVRLVRAAFGDHLKIREMREAALPVVQIELRYTDGTARQSEWNSLTGKAVR